MRGNWIDTDPFGLSAARRRAASSMSSQASCIRTGITHTRGGTGYPLIAALISFSRFFGFSFSASRCTNSMSQGYCSSVHRTRSLRFLGSVCIFRKSAQTPITGSETCCLSSQSRIRSRTLSELPSERSVNFITAWILPEERATAVHKRPDVRLHASSRISTGVQLFHIEGMVVVD